MKLTLVVIAVVLVCSMSAWATVGSQPYTVQYTCTGGLGPFPFAFPISEPAALTVNMNGTLLAPTSYTLTPVNNDYNNGGSVTLVGACTTGWIQILTRVTPMTQDIHFYDNMPIPMKTFERGLDKLTEIDQELLGTIIVNGSSLASPPPIGNITPNSGAFTT